MKQVTTQIIILKRLNYGEADRILTVLSSDQGKLSLLAKGVRKAKSKLAGGLELFSVSDVAYIDGRSDLKTVISTRLADHYGSIVENMDAVMLGYDLLKVMDKVTQETCEPEYFTLLRTTLVFMGSEKALLDLVYCWFAVRLLEQTGHGINTAEPAGGSQFTETDQYNFSFDDMAFFAHKSGQFRAAHIKLLRLLKASDAPDTLKRIVSGDELAKDVRPFLAQCLKTLF